MSKFLRAVSIVAAIAVVGGIVIAQNRANSQTSTQGNKASASASSSASSSHRGSANGNGSGTVGPWRDPNKEVWVILYTPGKNWQAGKSIYEQNLSAHSQYMMTLIEQNILLLGGPFKDSSGGEAVIQVSNEEEAVKVVQNDPAVTMGVMNAVLKPWHLVFENVGRTSLGGGSGINSGTGGGHQSSSSHSSGGG